MPDDSRQLFTRNTLLVAAVLLLAQAIALHLEGMSPWCKYGLGFWSWVNTHCTSQQFVDPYSLTHVLHGVIFYWALRLLASRLAPRWAFVVALAIEMAWEILENSPWVIERYRSHTASLDYRGDSVLNSLGDSLAASIGFVFASRFSWKTSLAFFVAVELLLLIFIRDNLTLNVLMLFFPIEGIKQWQLSA